MEEIIKIFRELQSTNSKNEKQAIIASHKDNELFKKCLVFLLDGNVVTGISKKKYNKLDVGCSDWVHKNIAEEFVELLEYIKKNHTGRDEDIIQCKAWCSSLSDEIKLFTEEMITKSLKLGCDDKTVNKAITGLIETWDVQLGSGFDKLKLKKNELFFLSQKLNGNRCSYVNGILMSRQGKIFNGFQHILDDIKAIGYDDYFIDGELIRKNVDGVSDGENFRIGTGIIGSDAPTKEEIKLVIFDMFPVSELKNKQSNDNYDVRREKLLSVKDKIAELGLQNIEIVTMVYVGTDTSEIDKWLQYAVDNDWEGLMLNKNLPYVCKRTTNLIKVKRFYTMDLEVVEVQEGDGRLKGTLGALVVKFKDNVVNVGSGFDDNTRIEMWENKESIIGRVIEVKYKEVTKDKITGLESLQFPVFVGLREENKCVSYD